MAKELSFPIAYLENSDFDAAGNLVAPEIPSDKPCVIMCWSSWCPHCTTAMPAFQQFANSHAGAVTCCCIQADGATEGERQLGKRLKQIKPSFRGFPDYLLYRNGKRVDVECPGRTVEALEQFSKM